MSEDCYRYIFVEIKIMRSQAVGLPLGFYFSSVQFYLGFQL